MSWEAAQPGSPLGYPDAQSALPALCHSACKVQRDDLGQCLPASWLPAPFPASGHTPLGAQTQLFVFSSKKQRVSGPATQLISQFTKEQVM